MTALDPATGSEQPLDAALDDLRQAAQRWAALPLGSKIELLRSLRERTVAAAERWTAAAADAKGVAGTPLEGEEALSGPWALIRALGLYLRTLGEIEQFGAPQLDLRRLRTRPDGTVVVAVFPDDPYDRLLLDGIRADVWMEPGIDRAAVAEGMGAWYRRPRQPGRVAVVLGAGNIASIAPLDVLYKLLADGAVCILKLNPVNQYLGPILEEIFTPLVEQGYVRFAYGGAEVGKALCSHPGVDEIHITGSEATHDRIVFGEGPDATERKATNRPLCTKPITSELGNVSPTIVIPGEWSAADFTFQAEAIASQKLHNDGFNCVAAQVLVVPERWDGTPKLLAAIEDVFRRLPDRPAYYPGALTRVRELTSRADVVFAAGGDGTRSAPRVLVRAGATGEEPILRAEVFASVLAVVAIPGDMPEYLDAAVRFSNDRLPGTLGANLIVHPHTMRLQSAAIDRAVVDLRYGCIAVNTWTGVGFLLAETPWGAFPGHTLDDVRSGVGVVHNAHLFTRTQKTVVYGPFAPFPRSLAGLGGALLPKPPWFVTNRNAARIGSALCRFEAHKTPVGLLRIALLALGG